MSSRVTLRFPLLFALLLAAAPAAVADTLTVPSDEFPTIQSAVIASEAGDLIKVKKGVYAENVTVFQRDITIQGKKAVIDGGYEGACLRIGVEDVTVTGMILVNGTHGIVDDVTEGGAPPDRLQVVKCEIRACETGIEVTADDVRIEKTVVRDCIGPGIKITALDTPGPVVLSRNTVKNIQQGAGIEVLAVSVDMERNQVSRCLFDGINVELTTLNEGSALPVSKFVRNEATSCRGAGLCVYSPFVGAVIERNEFADNGRGLVVAGQEFTIRDNECSRNAESGIVLGSSQDHGAVSVIEGNDVRENGLHGIQSIAPPICRIDPPVPNRFIDNDVRDNGGDGINLTHAHDDEFIKNVCRRNGGDGIDIDLDLDDILLDGNKCIDNEHEGIDNSGQDTVMRKNRCKKNARGVGPDLAGTGDDGNGTVIDEGDNVFGNGGFDVQARLDLTPGA